MAKISFQKNQIPFLLAGTGQLSLDTADLQLGQALDPGTPTILKASFDAGGEQKMALGGQNTVRLGVTTATAVELVPIFSSTQGAHVDLLEANGLEQFFGNGANADKVVLGFTVGGSAQVTASGAFNYSALKAGVELSAGGDAGYAYLRALDKTLPIERLLPDFFSKMRLPEQSSGVPEPGEAISFRYGGYLRLAAEVSAGYQLSGTKSVALGSLALSEKYDLSLIGKVGVQNP